LIQRLNAGLGQSPPGFGRKLSPVCAPAGFGKTTLLIQWINACRRLEPQVAAAWISLDKDDNDPNLTLLSVTRVEMDSTELNSEGENLYETDH
jgi:LuxR family maltose regulon positive regulatory protein